MKKKIIIAVCVVLCVAVAAVPLLVHFLQEQKKDIRNTPLPMSIDTADAWTAPRSYADVQFKTTLAQEGEMDDVPLFGKTYHAFVNQSSEQYTSEDGLVYAEEKLIDYYSEDEQLLYRSVIHRNLSDIYNAEGTLLYSCTNTSPNVEFDAEPIRWLFKDGAPAAAELYFTDTDSGNFGTAYYDGDGNLQCLYTELFGTDKDGKPANTRTYYNADFETIEKGDFDALLPDVDAPEFLYIYWA